LGSFSIRARRGIGARRSQCSFGTSLPDCDQAGQALGQSAIDAIIDRDEQTLHLAQESLGFESLALEPVLGVGRVSDFNALHSDKHHEEVQLCAFDILIEGGDDLRKLPLHLRKTSPKRTRTPTRGHFRQPVRTRRDRA
jgi:hypothetical protein